MEFKNEFSNATDLTLNRILEIKQNNEIRESDIIKYHYNQAVAKIKESYNNYLDYCYYRVPEFVSRLPSYDSIKIATKLVKYMTRKKFTCKLVFESNIYFEWTPRERPKDHIPFILKALSKRIELEAKNNNDYLFYEVPSILPEFPWYNTEDTAIIVAREIARRNFIVKLLGSCIFICWNKEQLEIKSNIKINILTKEEKRKNAIDKIEFINENRYTDFINPKRNKSSKIDFDEKSVSTKPTFDISNILNLYSN